VKRSLSHDQALFEQKLWLDRRAWQFVVHGTVQAALTAALTRLQLEPEPSEAILALVSEDLVRARTALTERPKRTIDLAEALAQVQSTWRGICDIQINLTSRAAKALAADQDACICVNEIVKEAISNAVRHGEAMSIKVEVERIEDAELNILVTNDGLPVASQQRAGVGSQLIAELTTDWSLTSNKRTRRTEFRANLPLQRDFEIAR
jgi:two-component sensor histidine kinase